MESKQKVTNLPYGELKRQIREVLTKNPFLTHEQVAKRLGLNYRHYRNYIKKETCLFFKEVGEHHHRLPDGKLVLTNLNRERVWKTCLSAQATAQQIGAGST